MIRCPIFYFVFCLIIAFAGCRQKNTLAQSEQSLIAELATLEALTEIEPDDEIGGTNLNIPEQSRKPYPANPIVILDILKAGSDIRDISVADLFTEIRYIPIKVPESIDTVWATNGWLNFEFLITPNSIIAADFSYGIIHFDVNGLFVQNLMKNDFYYTVVPKYKTAMISAEDRNQFVGNMGKVHALGDKVYYQYHNNPEGYGAMMMYNANPKVLSPMNISLDEQAKGNPKGREVFQFPTKKQKSGAASLIYSFNTFPINENDWAVTNSVMQSSQTGSFLISTNSNRDTLTKFKDYDPIRNFSGGVYRSLDNRGDQYSFKGIQHVRQSHNDTIYMLSESNRLIPKYVLDFGEKGIQSSLEGVDPKFSLRDKYIINDFIECERYLFIIYTQNAPSPNAARNKEVFYNACIYDKNTRELYHIYIDQPPYIPEGRSWPMPPQNYLANNLDDGPAFWPKKTTHDGKPFMWVMKNDISEKVNPILPGDTNDLDYLLMIAY